MKKNILNTPLLKEILRLPLIWKKENRPLPQATNLSAGHGLLCRLNERANRVSRKDAEESCTQRRKGAINTSCKGAKNDWLPADRNAKAKRKTFFAPLRKIFASLRETKLSGYTPAFCCLAIIATAWYTESIYTHSVKTIEGPQQQLSAYQGKKILFITLPITRTNAVDSVLTSIDSLGDANETTLKIIAVPSFEDGYTNNQKQALKNWYRQFLDSSIIITTGLYTRKSSGNQQHKVFKWLTYQSRNGFMNEEVEGPLDKFMVRANGELMGVLHARSKVGGAAMQRMLVSQ